MKMINIKYFAIVLILLCCLMGAASAADDVSADIVDTSVDDAVVDAGSDDASDSVESTVVEDEPVVDDSAPAQDESELGAVDDALALDEGSGESNLRDTSVIYVDPVNGNNRNDGTSNSTAVKTLVKAYELVSDGGTIFLNEGTYAGLELENYEDEEPTFVEKSVSFVGADREKTIIGTDGIWFSFVNPVNIDFTNLTMKGSLSLSSEGDSLHSELCNINFENQETLMINGYCNIIDCSFNQYSFYFRSSSNNYDVNVSSCTFTNGDYIFSGSDMVDLSVDYCSFINCKNIMPPSGIVNFAFDNSYFGSNDKPSISNIANWVVMSFENTTGLSIGEEAGFLVSFKKLAHADGTFTELEHPELLALPSYDVKYTLVNGSEVTHTLENLEDAATFLITDSGTVTATAAGQTLGITIGKDITLNIQKYDTIGYGDEQVLLFISDYNDITGSMAVTINGPNYSKEQTLDICGGIAFLTLKDLNVGEYTVEVSYSGDNRYYPQSNSTTFNVLPVESDDITLNVYLNNITFSEAADILVFIDPKGATGTVTITIDGNDVTEALDGNGIASFSIKGLAVKDYDVTVKYNGDSNFKSATTTAAFSVLANPIIDDLNEQLNQASEALANVTAEAAKTEEQLNQTKEELANVAADVAKAQEQVANLTADVAKVQGQVTQLTQENAKLTGDLSAANKNAAAASNNANAKIKKIKAAKTVKKSKKYVITVTLNKKVKGKIVFVAFNGKVYKAKTNAKGIAKVTIKKAALKKLAGKKVKYQVISGNSLKNKSVKVKK